MLRLQQIRLLSFLMAALFLFDSCRFEEVEFKKVEYVSVNNVNKKRIQIKLGMNLYNPNAFKIKVVDADLDLFIGGAEAGKADLMNKIILRKKREQTADILIEADYDKVFKAVAQSGLQLLFTKKIQVKVKGWIKGRVFVFGKKVDVEIKETVDIDQLKLN
jgi:LEA14-like dessication related protein